ncbi:MAG: rod shape-determining protein MreC [Luteitalea sp.]|nr:rod shape-determining protein MreC [Luteitalea sp.]
MPIASDRTQGLDVTRHMAWLLIVLLVGHVILISVQVSTRAGVPVLETVTFGAFAELQRGGARLYGGASRVWDRYVGLRGAEEEAGRLRRQVDALQLELQQERARVGRAAELEALLGLRQRVFQRTLAAQVIAGHPAGPTRLGPTQMAIIDRGREDGVDLEMAVIAPEGVVGRVIDPLSVHAAKVQLITDRNAGAGALLTRTGTGGVVVGNDPDPLLRLEYVSNLVDVRSGDLVVTSGLDGIYPRGLVIGRVERAEKGAALHRQIRVRPAVDFAALDAVLVVLDRPRVPAEMQTETRR